MSKSILANRIGKTLFNIAKENDVLSLVDNDLTESSKAILKEDSFITLMNNPNISKEKKCQIIDKSFENVNKYVRNAIKILANNLNIKLIEDVVEVFNNMNNIFNNRLVAKVESVYELSDDELSRLATTIKQLFNLDEVAIENVIDESLIGGLKISYNGKVIDASIKGKIQELQQKLATL
ncbi:ATP synthase F1 subunit delta [Gemella sp. GH3]|uniref:ATP synthase F1 subunit delta n=1 Tax=unclassified Gemella TaxID=2624949 RepID=UPI0015CFE4AA|nr:MULTISPECIES: ATP synthase F1 subunit delta [unclassified Gemella]MBF0714138.1 ATP synthase F1 subunit delta [Gemella sp. GH3.1]NYS51090.1 ATP synthase F1 subunit delta [Gemella sp. GH3]